MFPQRRGGRCGLCHAYWGEAYACGPFYNMTWEQFSETEAVEATAVSYRAVQKALARVGSKSAGTVVDRVTQLSVSKETTQ